MDITTEMDINKLWRCIVGLVDTTIQPFQSFTSVEPLSISGG